eukprot:1887159-Pleurochrysis_carterae.AAC.1
MNQVFKRFATNGNYMDVFGRCAKFWSVKAAQASFKKSLSHWSEKEVLSAAPPLHLFTSQCIHAQYGLGSVLRDHQGPSSSADHHLPQLPSPLYPRWHVGADGHAK